MARHTRLPRAHARRIGLLTLAGTYAALVPGAAAVAASVDGDLGQSETVYRRLDADDDVFLVLEDLDDLDLDTAATLDADTAATLGADTAATLGADTFAPVLGQDLADVTLAAHSMVTLTADTAATLADDEAPTLGSDETSDDTVHADATRNGADTADTEPSDDDEKTVDQDTGTSDSDD